MSPPPGPPAAGSQVPVLIRKFDLSNYCGLVELWVHFDSEGKNALDGTREEDTKSVPIQISSARPEERARLAAESAPGPSRSPPWPDAEYCILANILPLEDSWSERAVRFLQTLLDKKINGLVEDILMPNRTIIVDIPLASQYLCKAVLAKNVDGGIFQRLVVAFLHSKANLNGPSCVCGPCDQYFYPELQANLFEMVEVMEVSGPLNMFCKLSIFSKELVKLSLRIQQHYCGSAGSEPGRPGVCGALCAARGMDAKWYRSQLKQGLVTSGGSVEVLHVDFGKTELVPAGNVRTLCQEFLRMPVVTYRCSLHGVKGKDVKWNTIQIDYLKSILLQQTFMAEFQHHDVVQNTYDVTLYSADGQCVNKCFLEETAALSDSKVQDFPKESASPQLFSDKAKLPACSTAERPHPLAQVVAQTSSCPEGLMEVSLPYPPLMSGYNHSTHNVAVGSKEKVWITSFVSVHHFYCQLNRNACVFEKEMENVKQLFRWPQSADHHLAVNSLCIARYSDNKWYRGRITATCPNLRVHFVDYGDTLSLKMADIRPFPAELGAAKSLPVQAVPVALFNVPADVPQEVNDWVGEHAVGHDFTISVVAKDSNGKLMVELFYGPLNINATVRQKLATVKNGKDTGVLPQSIQPPCSTISKQTVNQIPNEHHETHQHVSVSPVLTMQHNEDHSISGECAEKNVHEPSVLTTQNNEDHSIGGECAEENEHEPSVHKPLAPEVSLPLGVDVASPEKKTGETLSRLEDLPRRLIEQGSSVVVHVSHFTDPSSFFVQIHQEENEIYEIAEKLNDPQCVEHAAPVELNDLHVGDLVSAEFPDDSSWYRAVVRQKLDDGTIQVQFIDFGNEATIPFVKTSRLDEALAALPSYSVLCMLGAACRKREQWDEDAISTFRRATTENPEKIFPCTFVKELDNVWEVVLKDKNVVLADVFVRRAATETNVTIHDCQEETVTICRYNKPNVVPHSPRQAYASCIAGPHFFWCQLDDSEALHEVVKLAQEAGRTGERGEELTDALGAGYPCLALFADDELWYRAQVIRKSGSALSVLYVDYGNESEVSAENVRAVPLALLEVAPQAFLCSLDGFDDSLGTWEDMAVDEFYDLLVDKPLTVTVLSMEENLESAVPQYAVKVEIGDTVLNEEMAKYWKESARGEDAATPPHSPQSEMETERQLENGELNTCLLSAVY